MNKKFSFIAVAVAILFCTASFAGDGKLRVMSYNLRFGELATMAEIGSYIKSVDADVVALQECDWDTHRERATHQNGVKFINELAHETGMFGIYGKTIDYRGGYYGIGLLSRYPIIRTDRILLPNVGKKEQRAMLLADIQLPDGKIITYICTHLEVSSAELRLAQVKFIQKKVKSIKNPVFLAGDMNAKPDSPEMAFLRKGWDDLTNRELTYSTKEPSIKIDYIYCRKGSGVKLIDTKVCHDTVLSDHFPVVANIEIN
ncbi:MAG: endonuclease/exonuclease/phosphatase family protein [Bacteroidales bacterium]|nr:endonuclease/exonuclease/phosphatase family protein [Candidatus Cryptobacteroides sp.]MED9900009.1 endonuclease/exonuclease/phosphatase family protein [Bacteroidales bacterium]HAW06566.1 endonuclease [Rikenellaceae bacterium]